MEGTLVDSRQATDCLPQSGHALIGTSSKTMTRAESHPGATRASTGIDMVYPNEEQGLISRSAQSTD